MNYINSPVVIGLVALVLAFALIYVLFRPIDDRNHTHGPRYPEPDEHDPYNDHRWSETLNYGGVPNGTSATDFVIPHRETYPHEKVPNTMDGTASGGALIMDDQQARSLELDIEANERDVPSYTQVLLRQGKSRLPYTMPVTRDMLQTLMLRMLHHSQDSVRYDAIMEWFRSHGATCLDDLKPELYLLCWVEFRTLEDVLK